MLKWKEEKKEQNYRKPTDCFNSNIHSRNSDLSIYTHTQTQWNVYFTFAGSCTTWIQSTEMFYKLCCFMFSFLFCDIANDKKKETHKTDISEAHAVRVLRWLNNVLFRKFAMFCICWHNRVEPADAWPQHSWTTFYLKNFYFFLPNALRIWICISIEFQGRFPTYSNCYLYITIVWGECHHHLQGKSFNLNILNFAKNDTNNFKSFHFDSSRIDRHKVQNDREDGSSESFFSFNFYLSFRIGKKVVNIIRNNFSIFRIFHLATKRSKPFQSLHMQNKQQQ